MCTHWECLNHCLFVSILPCVLLEVSFQSSICLHCVMGTHWGVLSIVYLSQLCHGYSLGCLVNGLFVSVMSWVLIGCALTTLYLSPLCHGYTLEVSCQSSICIHYVMGTHWECLVNRLFVSIMSWVLIGCALTTLYLSPLCHGYTLGVP